MQKIAIQILQDLYQKDQSNPFITMSEFEIHHGLTGTEIRSILEDLKDSGLVVEHEEGFQITFTGINYSKTKWV